MATVNLVFDRTLVKIGTVTLDVSLSEAHSSTNEVTDHPVEQGVNIVDHVRPKPDILRLEGMVSNTPLPLPTAETQVRTSKGRTFRSRSEINQTAAGTAYSDLLALKENATLVTVVTGLRTYTDMVIESLDVPRDARTGQTLRFSCTLKQVRTAVVQTAKVVPQQKNSKGKKATTPTTTEERGSVLSTFDEASGGGISGGIKGVLQ